MLKQGINVVLPVKFLGIDMTLVEEIDFIFKQDKCDLMPVYKTSVFKSDGTGDATLREGSTNIIDVPWTSDETYLFGPDSLVYMDTKIFVKNSEHNPITPIRSFTMCDTLFEQEASDSDDE